MRELKIPTVRVAVAVLFKTKKYFKVEHPRWNLVWPLEVPK